MRAYELTTRSARSNPAEQRYADVMILIDPPAWPAHGTAWSHLVSNTGHAELHDFAARLRIPRRSFDVDHYDLPASLYDRAIELGARPVSARDLLGELQAAGLRVRQVDKAAMRPVRRREYLVAEWDRLGVALGTRAGGVAGAGSAGPSPATTWTRLGADLLTRWSEPHRRYHDERHLEDVLLALDHLAVRGATVAPETLLAAWFHDAVYTGAQADGVTDEEASARLAEADLRRVGADAGLVATIAAFVRATDPALVRDAGATRETRPSTGNALAQLLDADISIFAAGEARYRAYAAAVRAEYAHVSDAAFRAGRAEILQRYLDRPHLYRTGAARELWETRARTNVRAEIVQLTGTDASSDRPAYATATRIRR